MRELTNNIKEIVNDHRGTGNTTYILKAAIHNPKVIIICRNSETSNYLKDEYKDMLKNSNWLLKLKWKIFGRSEPFFVSAQSSQVRRLSMFRRPIVFDNSSLF